MSWLIIGVILLISGSVGLVLKIQEIREKNIQIL
jgi:TM2 domain-containing membrane protein YozV